MMNLRPKTSHLPTGNSGILSSPPIVTDGVTVQVDIALCDLPVSLRWSFFTSQADLACEDDERCDDALRIWIFSFLLNAFD